MSDTMTTASFVDADGVLAQTALESRSDVDNLDALQAKRRQIVKELAPLAAKFIGGTTAGSDSARKRHRAGIAALILDEQPKGEKPPSEAALERMANADARHIDGSALWPHFLALLKQL